MKLTANRWAQWLVYGDHYSLQLEDDGLVLTSGNTLIITERGRLFLRNIAMIFDAYLSDSIRIRYSQTV